jgi:hypothetical protein
VKNYRIWRERMAKTEKEWPKQRKNCQNKKEKKFHKKVEKKQRKEKPSKARI